MARSAPPYPTSAAGPSSQPAQTITHPSKPPLLVWPTYYPCGGQSYIHDGRGIFVDPSTGVGLSVWIDPTLADVFGLVKAIWKEGGHISPSYENIATQILIISPHQSPARDIYCHPDRLPGTRKRSIHSAAPPSPGKEEPWQVKVMLDPFWVGRCIESGVFIGERYDWGGFRIGGPLDNIRTQPMHAAGRLRGEKARPVAIREESNKSTTLTGPATVFPPRRGSGNTALVERKLNSATIVPNGVMSANVASPLTGSLPSLTVPLLSKPTQNAQVITKRPVNGTTKVHPPQAVYPSPSAQPSSSSRRTQRNLKPKQRPKPLPAPTGSTDSTLSSLSSSVTPQAKVHRRGPMPDEVDSFQQDDAGPNVSDGEGPEILDRVKVVDRNTSLGALEEVFAVERMLLGPGVRENYLVGVLKKKYGTFSHPTWRDLYLSWLHQQGQYYYLQTGEEGRSHELPVDAFSDAAEGNSAAVTRYMSPSTLCWSDVDHIFEKENGVICAAALNNDEAGDYLADKYGVYVAATWKGYLIQWRQQRSGKLEPIPLSPPTVPTTLKAPAASSFNNSRSVAAAAQTKHAGAQSRPPRTNKRRTPTPPSSSVEDDDEDMEVSEKDDDNDDDDDDGDSHEDDDDLRKIKTGQLEYVSNEMMCKVFESRKGDWEKKDFSRVDIAHELEKDIGVYTHGSWQIYYTQWKTRKGRFAYLANQAKQPPRSESKPNTKAKTNVKAKVVTITSARPKNKGGRPSNASKAAEAAAAAAAASALKVAKANKTLQTSAQDPSKKVKLAGSSRTEFTEDEEKAMAEYVVHSGLTTVLPSYLTWQGFAEDPGPYPKRTPESYGVHCWRFRNRMEDLVAQAKGLPPNQSRHGQSLKRSKNSKIKFRVPVPGGGDDGADDADVSMMDLPESEG